MNNTIVTFTLSIAFENAFHFKNLLYVAGRFCFPFELLGGLFRSLYFVFDKSTYALALKYNFLLVLCGQIYVTTENFAEKFHYAKKHHGSKPDFYNFYL